MEPSLLLARIRELRGQSRYSDILEGFPPEWEKTTPDTFKLLLYFERGLARLQMNLRMDGWSDLELAYRMLTPDTPSADACWIVNGYAYCLRNKDSLTGEAMLAEAYTRYAPVGVQQGFVLWNWGWHAYRNAHYIHGLYLMERGFDVLQSLHHPDAFCVATELAYWQARTGMGTEAMHTLELVDIQYDIRSPNWKAKFGLAKALALCILGHVQEAAGFFLGALKDAEDASDSDLLSEIAERLVKEVGEFLPDHVREYFADLGVTTRNGSLYRHALRLNQGEVIQ